MLDTIRVDKTEFQWQTVCSKESLVEDSGVCALIGGDQVAIFYMPNETPPVYAIQNFDPIGSAYVLSRGIVGDVAGQLVVASPLYKQQFNLVTGQCIENDQVSVATYDIKLDGKNVLVKVPASEQLEMQ